jgi:hypothetical protein
VTYRELDTIVLTKDLGSRGLQAGDVGVVMYVYSGKAIEAKFAAAGTTRVVVTLSTDEFRPADRNDLLVARRVSAA